MNRQRGGNTIDAICAVIVLILAIATLVFIGWASGVTYAERKACEARGGTTIEGKCFAVKELK